MITPDEKESQSIHRSASLLSKIDSNFTALFAMCISVSSEYLYDAEWTTSRLRADETPL